MINSVQLAQIVKGKKFMVLIIFGLVFTFYFIARPFENNPLLSILVHNYSVIQITKQNKSHGLIDYFKDTLKFAIINPPPSQVSTSINTQYLDCSRKYGLKSEHLVIPLETLSSRTKLFVVGDIHGCFDEFIQLLKTSNVSCDTHLIILCGDIINKGPKSLETVRYIQSNEHCIYSVQGNHEQELNRYLNESLPLDFNIRSVIKLSETNEKYKWAEKLTREDICFITRLPYTISIPSFNVIVVHAGLKPEVPIKRQSKTTMVLATTMETSRSLTFQNQNKLTQKQSNYVSTKSSLQTWASLWEGPEFVIFGHDSARGLQRHKFAIGLDTGCVYGRKLTGIEIIKDSNGHYQQRIMDVDSLKTYVK